MTVAELIEALQDYDLDSDVWVLTSPVATTSVSHVSYFNGGKEIIIELSGQYYAKQLNTFGNID